MRVGSLADLRPTALYVTKEFITKELMGLIKKQLLFELQKERIKKEPKMANGQVTPKRWPWNRLTKVQRETLIRFGKSRHGDLHFDGRSLRTAWALKDKDYISGGPGNWYSITQRGRDYLQFRLRRDAR